MAGKKQANTNQMIPWPVRKGRGRQKRELPWTDQAGRGDDRGR